MKTRNILTILVCSLWISISAQPWFLKSDFGGEARHRASSFTIVNKGYIGLGHINSGVDVEYEDFWSYDPASDAWTQIANYPEGRCYHAASFVIGNKAYVGSGRLENGSYSKKFFEYDPVTNTWTQIADLPGLERRGAVGFVVNGKGYVGTGQTNSGYVADFYQYNPLNNQWTAIPGLPAAGRTSSVAFSIDNFGYVGTGNTNSGSSNDFYRYDPALNQWTPRANVGNINRQEAVGFAVNGLGYIGTGDDFSSGNNFSDMWEYDPLTNSWIQIEDFDGTARRYLTAFVIGSRAYAGTGTNGTNFRDFWMFDQILSVLQRKMNHFQPSVYPIPTDGKLTIDLDGLPSYIDYQDLTLSLFDFTGKTVEIVAFNTPKVSVETHGLSSGSYIYQIKHQNEVFYSGKIVKQ